MLMSAMQFLPISNLTSRKLGKQRGNHIYILEVKACEILLATFIFLKIYILLRSLVQVIVLQNLVIFDVSRFLFVCRLFSICMMLIRMVFLHVKRIVMIILF